MLLIMTLSMISFLITFIIMMLANLISKKMIIDREKSSPFECGFDPKSSPRMPFSLQFFLIAVIFIIFDIEITLLLPLTLMIKITNIFTFSMMMMIFIMILILGIYHEWKQGALNWAY